MALKKYAARKNTFSCGIFCVCEGKINFLPRSPRPMVPAEAFPVPLFFCRTIIPCQRSLCRWRSVFHWNNWSKILPVFQNHWHLPGWSMESGIPDVLKVFPEARQSNEPELFKEEHRQTCWSITGHKIHPVQTFAAVCAGFIGTWRAGIGSRIFMTGAGWMSHKIRQCYRNIHRVGILGIVDTKTFL